MIESHDYALLSGENKVARVIERLFQFSIKKSLSYLNKWKRMEFNAIEALSKKNRTWRNIDWRSLKRKSLLDDMDCSLKYQMENQIWYTQVVATWNECQNAWFDKKKKASTDKMIVCKYVIYILYNHNRSIETRCCKRIKTLKCL